MQYYNQTMGATKTEHFSAKQNQLAVILKAIAHPARIAIIEHLLKVQACICVDIVNELPLAQPTVSQHLRELKNAGIIKGNIEGTAICYCLDEKVMAQLNQYFSKINIQLEKQKNACC